MRICHLLRVQTIDFTDAYTRFTLLVGPRDMWLQS